MKTVEEFIQRLQNDPEFEHKAQGYENSDEFMEFVKGEGYDFTLDQLLDEFKHEQPETKQPVEEPSAPSKTVEDFIQRLQDDPEFEQMARAFENHDDFLEFVKDEGYDFTMDQLTDGLKRGRESLNLSDDTPLKSPKATVIPMSRLLDHTGIRQEEDPTRHHVEEQKRPGTLSPKFEGSGGGRRRGMKWRNNDSEAT